MDEVIDQRSLDEIYAEVLKESLNDFVTAVKAFREHLKVDDEYPMYHEIENGYVEELDAAIKVAEEIL